MQDSHLRAQRRSIILIRVSSILMAALTFGHMASYPWSSAEHGSSPDLVSAMKTTPLVLMGQSSSYWNLFFGCGLLIGLLLLSLSIVLWLLADVSRVAPRGACRIAGSLAAACFAGAYVSLDFLFWPPALLFIAIGVTLATAASELWRPRYDL